MRGGERSTRQKGWLSSAPFKTLIINGARKGDLVLFLRNKWGHFTAAGQWKRIYVRGRKVLEEMRYGGRRLVQISSQMKEIMDVRPGTADLARKTDRARLQGKQEGGGET